MRGTSPKPTPATEDLDARILALLARHPEGLFAKQIREELAARAAPSKISVALGRLERRHAVVLGERHGERGHRRLLAPTTVHDTTSPEVQPCSA